MRTIVAFDVNETLLDLRALDPHFARVFGDAAVRPVWFSQMLQIAFVGTITKNYVDFTAAQHAALRMLAARRGRAIGDEDADAIVAAMRALPAYPEVDAALRRLAGAGFPLAALTNSTREVAEAQLAHAGIHDVFAQVCSADEVRRLKPAPEPYQLVAARFATSIDRVLLVAAHAWDIAGALAAGCRAAFVARPGMVLSPIGPQPEMIGGDLRAVVEEIIRRER